MNLQFTLDYGCQIAIHHATHPWGWGVGGGGVFPYIYGLYRYVWLQRVMVFRLDK